MVILTSDKPIQDQLKLIICEESIATTFGVCFKCGSRCTVSVGDTIGSYCKIYISCCSSAEHNIIWSTGPLLNRLPALNLLMASTILSTGLECNKTLRFMESLNILCLKRRELSNVQSAYVIPAVINVWKSEQRKQLSEIEGKAIEIASDIRVDSLGHCGLLGAGSTLDPERNVVLDTQIIKVLPIKMPDKIFSTFTTIHKLNGFHGAFLTSNSQTSKTCLNRLQSIALTAKMVVHAENEHEQLQSGRLYISALVSMFYVRSV